VFGVGYVGAVSAACFAERGHEVVGVDVNADKVAMIEAGQSPVLERGLADLVADAVAAGRLRATTDVGRAVASTDIALVCVDEHIPHLSRLLHTSADEVAAHADVAVLDTSRPAAIDALRRAPASEIIDLVRPEGADGLRDIGRYTGVAW
jgi:hypothetical protein